MTAPREIVDLVERFDRYKDQYTSGNYNEAQLRQEFLNPFFAELGWDVENRQGYAEPYKEVIHEDAVKVGTATKAPDYSFRIGGTRKFFVEAKNPSVNLKEDISPAYQLRRYAWSAKLPLSILTDFHEFAVYDCRTKPLKTDKASSSRIQYITYSDYVDHWDTIAAVFSKDAVLKGSFDKYAEAARGKKGTAEVDDTFLKEIESWRQLLAKNFALRNSKLTQRELNFAVQRTIDRLIFLRICEDRGIETYGRLLSLVNGERAYRRLCEYFYRADERYNSGLFHFEREKGRPEEPDELTPNLHLDDKPLKEILGNLYYPDCPYEFSVLPADILGQVYEQFLGKVIRLTSGHQAKVEDKPEVKKAGGVYYTPTYIVDYIVKNTVGKLLNPDFSEAVPEEANVILNEAKRSEESAHRVSQGVSKRGNAKSLTPKEASRLRILDPACGSGSFLIGAYQYLLDWHRDWYEKDSAEKYVKGRNAPLFRGPAGDWRLTTAERKRILLNNIYGVDIDSQAVEVTKLSLLLKVLEGENEQTISQQLKMFHERALPDLGNNIKCGNSLIGPDFYEGKQLSLLDDEEKMRINVFDWKKEFKEIMDAGGFDAVIGNPPYGAEFDQNASEYVSDRYSTYVLRIESYIIFLERALQLLRNDGLFGYIIPDTYLNLAFSKAIRRHLLANSRLLQLVVLPSNVFEAAVVDTTILFASKAPKVHQFHPSSVFIRSFNKKTSIYGLTKADREQYVNTELWWKQESFNVQATSREHIVLSKLDRETLTIDSIAEMFSGIKAYEVGKGTPPQTEMTREKKPFTSDNKRGDEWLPLFDGKHVGRYELLWKKNNWIKYGPWLAAPREAANFLGEKILIRKIVGATLISTYVKETSYCNTLLFILKLKSESKLSHEYILGILNSRLIGWYFRKKFQISSEDTFPQIMIRDILQFPIPRADKTRHDKMVELVEQMLALHKQLPATKTAGKPAAKTEHEKTVIQRQIEATDKQIDQLVYELYGLTEEEIKIVEGKT